MELTISCVPMSEEAAEVQNSELKIPEADPLGFEETQKKIEKDKVNMFCHISARLPKIAS